MNATPWSLDEFVAHDVFFGVVARTGCRFCHADVDLGAIEADFQLRLAAERARIEADAYARGRADGERAARATLEQSLHAALGMLGRPHSR
jgi:flagellar assembly protein FliH